MDYISSSQSTQKMSSSNKKSKLNNSVQKIKNTIVDKNLNYIKKYLPETPNIILNFREVSVPDSIVEISNFKTDMLDNRFQDITYENTQNEEDSSLVMKRYNVVEQKIEISNRDEFTLIKKFLEEGEFMDLMKESLDIETSNLGCLIMEGYRRFLKKSRFITLNFHEVFQYCHQNKNNWYYADEINQNLMFCFQELENQYLDIIDERYYYLGCMIFSISQSKKQLRIPIYLDKNSQIGFPTMRKIGKHYFTIYNISFDKEIYLDFDIDSQEIFLITDEKTNLVRYVISQKGISFHTPFPDYLTEEYMEEIKETENKHLI